MKMYLVRKRDFTIGIYTEEEFLKDAEESKALGNDYPWSAGCRVVAFEGEEVSDQFVKPYCNVTSTKQSS